MLSFNKLSLIFFSLQQKAIETTKVPFTEIIVIFEPILFLGVATKNFKVVKEICD